MKRKRKRVSHCRGPLRDWVAWGGPSVGRGIVVREQPEDPHSPRVLGLRRVLWKGAELYRREADVAETLDQYGDFETVGLEPLDMEAYGGTNLLLHGFDRFSGGDATG